MIRYLAAAVLGFGLCVLSWAPIATAQPPRQFPCPVIDGRIDADCVNGRMLAMQDQLSAVLGELRYTQEALRQARDAKAGLTRDEAWSIAGDRVYSDLYRFGLLR